MKKTLIFILILFLIIITGVSFYLYKAVHLPYKGYQKAELKIEIKKGTSISKIADLLYQKKIISSPRLLKLYLKIKDSKVAFKAGEYFFKGKMSIPQVVHKLKLGKVVLYKITIPEGWSIKQIEERLIAMGVINPEDILPKDQEGFLFPERCPSQRRNLTE